MCWKSAAPLNRESTVQYVRFKCLTESNFVLYSWKCGKLTSDSFSGAHPASASADWGEHSRALEARALIYGCGVDSSVEPTCCLQHRQAGLWPADLSPFAPPSCLCAVIKTCLAGRATMTLLFRNVRKKIEILLKAKIRNVWGSWALGAAAFGTTGLFVLEVILCLQPALGFWMKPLSSVEAPKFFFSPSAVQPLCLTH